MAGDNEMDEILSDDAEQSTTQQYEGDDIGALATAKQRMAERDAEYSAAFAKAAEKAAEKPKEKPAKRQAKPRSKPESKENKEVPAFAEDAPATERKPEMTAPAVKAVEQKVRKVAADNAEAGNTKYADVKGGLRGLKGGSDLPEDGTKKDRAEYLAAWKDR